MYCGQERGACGSRCVQLFSLLRGLAAAGVCHSGSKTVLLRNYKISFVCLSFATPSIPTSLLMICPALAASRIRRARNEDLSPKSRVPRLMRLAPTLFAISGAILLRKPGRPSWATLKMTSEWSVRWEYWFMQQMMY